MDKQLTIAPEMAALPSVNITQQMINYALRKGSIKGARKVGRDWVFSKAAFWEWYRNRPRVGRPKSNGSRPRDKIEIGMAELGMSWCGRKDKYVSPDDEEYATPTYHIKRDGEILRFYTLKEIQSYIQQEEDKI